VSIELLWIIPSVSFAFFIALVIYIAQKKSLETSLKQEVTNFNNGIANKTLKGNNPEHRLEELERAINLVTNSITNQQKIIDRFKQQNTDSNEEIGDLKDKLRELYKEYDIVLSENFSLRAKMKKMMVEDSNEDDNSSNNAIISGNKENKSSRVNLKLYEDTRVFNVTEFNSIENINDQDMKSVS
jgi:septal ring factor EnvC (AmiA/AmiB activator)